LDILPREYLPILIFLGMAVALGLVLILAAVIIAVRNPDPEKVSAYECGFNAFDDARMKFDVRFYLVSILFIIFDLEVAFLFPWAISLKEVGVFGFWSMMIFLGVLTIGFIYECRNGCRHRRILVGLNLHADAAVPVGRQQVIDHVEPPRPLRPVYGAQIDQLYEPAQWIVAEEF